MRGGTFVSLVEKPFPPILGGVTDQHVAGETPSLRLGRLMETTSRALRREALFLDAKNTLDPHQNLDPVERRGQAEEPCVSPSVRWANAVVARVGFALPGWRRSRLRKARAVNAATPPRKHPLCDLHLEVADIAARLAAAQETTASRATSADAFVRKKTRGSADHNRSLRPLRNHIRD